MTSTDRTIAATVVAADQIPPLPAATTPFDGMTWRNALGLRWGRTKRQFQTELDNYVRQERARKRIRVVLTLLIVAAVAWAFYFVASKPLQVADLKSQVKTDTQEIARLKAPGYPYQAAASVAHLHVSQCLNYSDQLTTDQITALGTACGWNGHGVANVEEIYYDQDPNLVAHVVSGQYAAIPFRVQLSNAADPLLYYVPVHQTGTTTAEVVGQGAFFLAAPGFIAANNTVDGVMTSERDSPIVATVTQFLAGASRYTAPGVTIPLSNGTLKVATAAQIVIYNGTDTNRVASALVTYTGPTQDAQFTERIAFKLTKSQNGDWVVQAIGPDTNANLSGGN